MPRYRTAKAGDSRSPGFRAAFSAEQTRIAREAATPEAQEKSFQWYVQQLQLPDDVVAMLRQLDIREANTELLKIYNERGEGGPNVEIQRRVFEGAEGVFSELAAAQQSHPAELRKALLANPTIRRIVGVDLKGLGAADGASASPWIAASVIVGAYFLLKK